MPIRFIFVIVLLLFKVAAIAQGQFLVKQDLQSRWQVAVGDQYKAFDSEETPTTIYFNINPTVYGKDYLVLKATHPFSVLVNNALLVDQAQQLTLSIDSLTVLYPSTDFFVAIHSTNPIATRNLSTEIKSAVLISAAKPEESYIKADTRFRDFAITAMLVLIVFLISVIRLNPGLSADFFSARKIFSFRENEDDHHYYRVTSGTILFYVLTSILISLYIIVVAKFTTVNHVTASLEAASYGMIMFTWLKLSLYTLFFLFIKITVIYLISTLFGIRAVAGYHFFNFIRMLLVASGVLTAVLLVYYIPHGQRLGFYNFLYTLIPWILGAWILLGFFKLAARVHHSAFHLFSYICITELIPFLLILRVLNT